MNKRVKHKLMLDSKRKYPRVYIAGPMSGIKLFNAPAFMRAGKILKRNGFKPVNPAELDHGKSGGDWAKYLKRDIPHLLKCDGVCVLPGWEKSKGARLEVHVARAVDIPVYALIERDGAPIRMELVVFFPDNAIKFGPPIHEVPEQSFKKYEGPCQAEAGWFPSVLTILSNEKTMVPPPAPTESVLQEAERLINGDRNASYGPPNQDFQRTADMWTGLLQYKLRSGEKIRAQDVGWMMILLKASRGQQCNKRDSVVDAAGYAGCVWRCIEEEERVKG